MGVSSSANSQGMDRFSSSSGPAPDSEKVSFGDPGMAHLREEVQHRVEQIILIKKKATLTYNVRLESVACLEFAFSANTRTHTIIRIGN